MDIRDDVDYLRGLAWTGRKNSPDHIIDRRKLLYNLGEMAPSMPDEHLELYFEAPQGNVLTAKNLQVIQAAEDKFYSNKKFQTSFCELNATDKFTKGYCILWYFDDTYEAISPQFRKDANFSRISEILHAAKTNNLTRKPVQTLLGKDAQINSSSALSEITRCYIPLSRSPKGHANDTDRENEYREKVEDFTLSQAKSLADEFHVDGTGELHLFSYSPTLMAEIGEQHVILYVSVAIGVSVLVIAVYVGFRTRSLWISGFTVCSIFCCFFATSLLYRGVFGIPYFGIINGLAIFAILCIGANDVSSLLDTWKAIRHDEVRDLTDRLYLTCRKTLVPMLCTTLMTVSAFIYGSSSPFLAVSVSSTFCAILVSVNYSCLSSCFFPQS